MGLFDVLNEFQRGKSHLAIVTENQEVLGQQGFSEGDEESKVQLLGVVTLEVS